MKKSKNKHLGLNLQEIIKIQSESEWKFLDDILQESKVHDIVTGEEIETWKEGEDALTIFEDIDKVIAEKNISENAEEISVQDTDESVSITESEVNDLEKKLRIIRKKDFGSFVFIEKEDQFEIVIEKRSSSTDKDTLQTAFVDIITQVSDVNQFV